MGPVTRSWRRRGSFGGVAGSSCWRTSCGRRSRSVRTKGRMLMMTGTWAMMTTRKWTMKTCARARAGVSTTTRACHERRPRWSRRDCEIVRSCGTALKSRTLLTALGVVARKRVSNGTGMVTVKEWAMSSGTKDRVPQT